MRWLDWLHIVDSSFPSGAYVHSMGLETLAPATSSDLEHMLELRVRETLGRFELVFLLRAYTDPLIELDEQFHAMVFPREAREASSLIGAGMVNSACAVLDDPRLAAFQAQAPHHHQPIAFGAVAAACEAPPHVAASTYAFQCLRSLTSASQRLGRLGQRDAQLVLHRLKPAVGAAVGVARNLSLAEAGAFNPLWDVASMRHERAPVRMFAS
ncbi:MAG TPA: urease accessory UreF family protein [Chloroflexota bacterium]|nr:urease accessory UreF family protein [Chloroflexota bacterium]